MNELNNSKLSNIRQKGIHIDKNLYIGISSFIEIMSGINSVHSVDSMDCLNINLNDKDFDELLNTKISSDLLDDEVIDIIETYTYKDSNIEFVEEKNAIIVIINLTKMKKTYFRTKNNKKDYKK